jgi:hypothetical protein
MRGEPEDPRAPEEPALESDTLQEERNPTQDDLLFTLEICRNALPMSAHPVHWSRLRYLEGLVRYWVRSLVRS